MYALADLIGSMRASTLPVVAHLDDFDDDGTVNVDTPALEDEGKPSPGTVNVDTPAGDEGASGEGSTVNVDSQGA